MVNPFKYGREVSGRQFYDRQEAFDSLYSKLAGGSANVVMYAPRRYGKTSLVKKVLARFSGEGVPCVYFDLNRVESLERFCEAYASALYSLVGGAKGIAHTLAEYLSHLHPTFSFGGEFPVSVKFDYGAKMSSTSLAEVLGLAEKIAVEHVHGSIIVAFDEFQEIRGLSPDLPLEGIFRGVIQEQQNVRYVFFGSKTHMLKRMFGEKSRPFYKSAATIRLGKPPEDQSRAFVAERFASCGIGVDAAEVSRIVEVSENIPYYLQELSSQVFDEVMSAGRDWVEPADVGEPVADGDPSDMNYVKAAMKRCQAWVKDPANQSAWLSYWASYGSGYATYVMNSCPQKTADKIGYVGWPMIMISGHMEDLDEVKYGNHTYHSFLIGFTADCELLETYQYYLLEK